MYYKNKVEEEKMKKIITTSIILGLVLIIGISTLVLALIPIGINDKIGKPNEIYIASSQTTTYPNSALTYRDRDVEDRDFISNIYSVFSRSFEQKVLSALFRGEVKDEIKTNYNKKSESLSKNTTTEDKFTIVFKYNTSQNIKAGEKGGTYKYLFFEITSSGERSEVVMGVSSDITVSSSSYHYNYSYIGKANFGEMFKYIKGLV